MSVRNQSDLPVCDEFFVLDLDRCLLDTDKVQALLEYVLRRDLGIESTEMNDARKAHEASGGSFDTAGYVMTLLDKQGQDGPSVWHTVEQRFIDEALQQDLLQPFAHQFIYELRLHKKPYGVVTFGGAAWQSAKIAAAGLVDIPHLITHELEKGRLLSSWRRDDGVFLLPSAVAGSLIYAKHIVFVDDKPVSFVGLPPDVTGIWAIAPRVSWPSSAYDTLPQNVTPVQGMQGAIELLFSHKEYLKH